MKSPHKSQPAFVLEQALLDTADSHRRLELPTDLDLSTSSRPDHHVLPSSTRERGQFFLRVATRIDGAAHQILVNWDHASNSAPHSHRTANVACWGPQAKALSGRAEDILGLCDRTHHQFRPTKSPVHDWWLATPHLRLPRCLSVLEILVPTVLEQRILGKEALAIAQRLNRKSYEQAPGPPGLSTPSGPDHLLALDFDQWHQLGLERSRARTIHHLAKRASWLENSRDLDTETLYQRLVSIPGIGPWSANRVLTALGHADAVCVGDYNLPSYVAWNLAGEPRADDRRMLELLEPYRGHRARVLRLISLHGKQPPRFGPRLPFRNIQNH